MRLPILLTLLCLPACTAWCDTAPSPQELIRRMGDPQLTVKERYAASNELSNTNDKSAIPLLIEALKDKRVLDPAAEAVNAPVGLDSTYVLTVGVWSEGILVHLVSKGAASLGAWQGDAWPCYDGMDWPAWWLKHQQMSLDEIQTEESAMCREYYKSKNLVDAMRDPKATVKQHRMAADELSKLGKPAILALIRALKDKRVFDPAGKKANGGMVNDKASLVVTVGQECNTILAGIISDNDLERVIFGAYPVPDWNAWWLTHRLMTLKEIQQEVADAYAQYSKTHH